MKKFYGLLLAGLIAALPGWAAADQLSVVVDGICEEGQSVAAQADIVFTPTGGDFVAGTGTADVTITLQNISGLYPYAVPAIGNPVLTAFFFNVTPGAGVVLTEARILAGSNILSTGTTILGFPIPAGCIPVALDQVQSGWYELVSNQATGQYGIFTTGLETLEGIKAGLVDPSVVPGCVQQGDVFSPLVIAGQVAFTVSLSGLDESLDSAIDFESLCSVIPGEQLPSAFGAKFQGTATNGEGSCFSGAPGECRTVPTSDQTWGGIKALFE